MRFRFQAAAFLLAGASLSGTAGAAPFSFGFDMPEKSVAFMDVAMNNVVSALLLLVIVLRELAPLVNLS
jgi:hypothetical protein